uniref:Uncharacterized protein n=1 Tax=Arundo donax TaxID=35708 RepID=A0A0A9AJY9_ARUDO
MPRTIQIQGEASPRHKHLKQPRNAPADQLSL